MHTFRRLMWIAIALPCAGCSLLGPPREPALDLIEEVEEAVGERERWFEDALKASAKVYFEQLQARLDLEWRAALDELRIKVYVETERRRLALGDEMVGRLEEAIDPVLARLDSEHAHERNLAATGAMSSLERQNRLAAELSATLAVTLREGEKIRALVHEELEAVRAAALAQIEDAKIPLRIDPAREAEAFVAGWMPSQGGTYAESVAEALEQIRRHVDGKSPLRLVIAGAGGDRVAEEWAGRLEDKARGLLDQGVSAIEDWTERKFRSVTTELEGEVRTANRPASAGRR